MASLEERDEASSLPKKAVRRKYGNKEKLTTQELSPQDIMDQGGDFKTTAKFQNTIRNSPFPDAVLDQIPAPRGRGSASRIDPMTEVDGVARRVKNQEATYFAARNSALPFTWLIQQDEADLAFMNDPESFGLILAEMYQNEEFVRNEQKYKEQVDRRTGEILQAREKNENFWLNLSTTIGGLSGGAPIRWAADKIGLSDDPGDPDARRQAELELMGQVAPARPDSLWTDFRKAAFPEGEVMGIMNEMAEWINVAGTLSIATTGYAVKGLSGGRVDPLAYMEKLWRENLSGQRAEVVEILNQPEQERIKSAREQYKEAWAENVLAEGGFEDFTTMGIGDVATTRALIDQAALLMFDNDPELQNQVMSVLEEENKDLIVELDKRGYEASGFTSALVGWYGHNVPNRAATYFTVFFAQDDLNEFFTSDGFIRLHEEAVAANFQPSKVLGIDGTWQGIGFDLGMGGLFDPLNFFLGPAGRSLGISNIAAAARIARAPATRHILRDTAKAVRSYFRDDASSVALLEGMGEFGMYDEFMAAAVGTEKVFSGRAWLNHKHALVTRETPVASILDNLPDDVVAEGSRQAGRIRAAGAVDESVLLLDQPAVIQYSRAAGGITMAADDVARLILAREVAGTQSVAFPMYGRVIDNLADDTVRVLDDVKANPGDYVYHVSKGPIEGDWTGGGISHRPMTRTDAAAASGERLYFKRSDIAAVLDERALKYFENGGDIEQLLPQGSYVSRRANRPVATGPMPQPVTRLTNDELARYQNPASTRVPEGRLGKLADDSEFMPVSLIDENVLFPELKDVMPKLEALAERLYARGGGMSLPMRTSTSRIFANDIREAFRNSKTIGPWALRFWTRQNVGVWLRTHGFGWEQDIRQTIFRMFGHDEIVSNLWMRRFREAMRPGADDQAAALARRIEIKNAADELRYLDDNANGILGDDPTQVLGEPVQAVRVGHQVPDEAMASEAAFRAYYDDLTESVSSKTKYSHTSDWTPEERAAYDLGNQTGDYSEFSRVRGYTDEEFAEFEHLKSLEEGTDMVETRPYSPGSANEGGSYGVSNSDEIYARLKVEQADELRLADEVAKIENEASLFEADKFSAELIARRNEAKANLARLEAAEVKAAMAAQRGRGVAGQKIIRDMWDDFNRRYIATNKFWADKVDKKTGMVPWELITGGTRKSSTRSGLTVPSTLDDAADVNSVIHQLMDDLGDPGVMVPLAPIDMIAASELGGAKWMQWEQMRFSKNIQDFGNFLDRIWKMDKVFRISTAITVNMDEMIRVFHRYGAPSVMQWIEDHVMFTAARAKALIGDRAPAAGLSDSVSGSRAIFHNKRWNARMQKLDEYPEFYKHVERQYYEMFEDSWDDIAFGESEWLPAMDTWTSNLLQQDGFRAYLRGREEFSKWWASEEAGYIRNKSTLDFGDGRTRLATENEAFGGFEFLMKEVFLGKVKGGRFDAVRVAFIDAANRIAGGEQAVTIPQAILREMQIPVRGVRNLAPSASSAGRLSNKFFDNLFMQPTNYRRGFIAEIARKYETRRLQELYQSQGINIIPDWKINSVLPEYNVRNTAAFGLPEAIEQMLFDKNIVTQGTIARMAERKAMAEMEHIMYTWHQTSRAGRSPVGRAAFPFGKPYYDMWAHYGREMMTRPALRGYINNSNFGNLANKALDHFPINPKAPALVSRIAATDFSADKQNMDFSPLLFFPTEGDNSLMAVLPGIGLLPMWIMDFVVSNVYDPFEQPVEYQNLVESISQWIPSFGFQQTGLAGRAFGGGLVASGFKAATDAFMIGGRRTFHEPLSLIGDIQNEIQTNRAVKAILADPEEWEVLMSAREDELPAMFDAIIGDSFGRGAGDHLKDITSRWFVPIDFDFDTTADDVQDVWLNAAEKFPQLAPRYFTRDADEDTLAENADDIRRAFFDLPGEERDKMLVQYPQLAVNMVSGWEWTDKAEDEFPYEANTPYKTIGGQEGLARHQSLIRNDYVRPVSVGSLMARILGTVFEARVNLAKSLYTEQAVKVNDYIWEQGVPANVKAFLNDMVTDGTLDATDGREVWENFTQYQDKIEAVHGPTSIPSSMEPWGTSWRGLEEDGFSARYKGIVFGEGPWAEITPETAERARILGIEVEEGMTGEQFVGQIHDLIRNNVAGSALPSFVNDEFQTYRTARGEPANAAHQALAQLVAGENGDPLFKESMNDFLDYERRTNALRNENGRIDPERARNVAEQYTQLMTSNPELNFSWEEKWHDAFESDYGPLNYRYPTPPQFNPNDFRNTYRPYVWDVQDGDTLVVSTEPSAPWLDLPGTRFDILSGGTPQKHSVRLLGIYAPEMAEEEGKRWLDQLTDAIMEAKRNGIPIHLVRDPSATGNRNVDFYGRELAWLFIGGKPYYYPETIPRGS